MIPDDVVDEVRARADIVDIIGELLPLKRAGKEYKANCPFHEERTPSFYVVPEKGFYKCFGCGKSGDVFAFVMERLGLDFVDAVKYVAGRSGVEVREVTRQHTEDDAHRALYELNAFAQAFFRERFLDERGGSAARRYLERRGIGTDVAERFGLGFAPDEWRALRDAAAKHELDENLMVEVGLLSRSEKTQEPYDRFRGRIMFPIEGLSSRVIAFGGRVLTGERKDAPKYLNSPETPVFHKGSNLYGLSWARNAIRRDECALVVEGYMDVVALAAHGFENVVAPLGTAMTEEQAKLLARYTSHILLLFDSDTAGLRATFRAGDLLLEQGLSPAVVTLPPGEDPDTLVRRQGPDVLRGFLDHAVDVLDRKLQILEAKDFFSSIERTRAAVDRLLPTLRAAADPALHDIYVAKVADRTGVRRETLESELRRERAPTRTGGPAPVRRASRAPLPLPRLGAERSLLLLMTKSPEFAERAGERVAPSDFVDPAHRTIFEALLGEPELRSPPAGMSPEAVRKLEELLADPQEIGHAAEVFEDSVARIRIAALDRRSQELDRLLASSGNDDEKRALIEEKVRVSGERRALGPDDWTMTARRLRAKANPNDVDR